MHMVMDTLPEPPVKQGKLYQELQKSGDGSDAFFQYSETEFSTTERRWKLFL